MTSSSPEAVVAEVREGQYGSKVVAVEPGGAEFIPLSDRHGKPHQLFWTWMSPNLEFSTVFVGILGVVAFNLSVLQAVAAIIIGNALGSVSHGILSARGPKAGVPQMVLSRISFGLIGNVLPAGLNAIIASIGWFAVNSVSGAFALSALTHMDVHLALILTVVAQIIIAFIGHNFLQMFERVAFPLLAIAFILAAFYIIPNAHASAPAGGGGLGFFLITVGAAFGYACGWNPFASDYTRYLAPTVSGKAVGWAAGLGVFVSCTLLESLGALAATLTVKNGAWFDAPTAAFTSPMPTALADLVLLAIFLGSVCANAINVYSGSMSFLALGLRIPGHLRRAIVVLVSGVLGGLLGWIALTNVDKYSNFLLVIAYWVGPWLGVFFMDQFLRRRHNVDGFMFDRKHNPWAGFVAMAVGIVISIWLFSNQTQYVGVLPTANSAFGDLTFEVGFVLSAVLYLIFFKMQRDKTDEVLIVPVSV